MRDTSPDYMYNLHYANPLTPHVHDILWILPPTCIKHMNDTSNPTCTVYIIATNLLYMYMTGKIPPHPTYAIFIMPTTPY